MGSPCHATKTETLIMVRFRCGLENLLSDVVASFININIKSNMWLLYCTYDPNKFLIENHLRQLQKHLEASGKRYEHFLIMGDFNANVFNHSMTSFCTLFQLKNIVKEPTWYKSPQNPSCIDSFLTSCPRSFHNTCVYETGLSDFLNLVVTILWTSFEPLFPKIIKHRSYKSFDEDQFPCLFKKRLNELNTDDSGRSGLWTLDSGPWTLNCGRWTLHARL